jgi:serine/threonine protein kinase
MDINLPDLSPQGYQIDRVLGQNVNGGRVTYLAQELNTDRPVVIKQFQFATIGNSWSDYDSYQREVEILQQLDHPHIPKYLTSWETPNGFCLAQEYKQGENLARVYNDFDLDRVQQIAIEILKILVYLQQQQPPIIHRDLKPENILIDDRGQIYLLDFGFARPANQDLIASSTVRGTLGFMPPEQLFNQPLTKSADLYSLGITLVCLLTKIQSTKISQLIDHNYRLDLQNHREPPRNPVAVLSRRIREETSLEKIACGGNLRAFFRSRLRAAFSAGRDRRRVRSLTPFKTDKQSSRKEGGGRRTSARFG